MRRYLVLAGVVVSVAIAGAGCGVSTAYYDCSGARADGHGGCVPNDPGPRRVVQAAMRALAADGADSVSCFRSHVYRHRGQPVDVWGCYGVKDGRLGHDAVCIVASHGRPVGRPFLDSLSPKQRRCP
jgi:hypothetical protein